MKNNQMELEIETKTTFCRGRRRQRRLPGARWWFDQMHRAVDHPGDADTLRRIKQEDLVFPNGRN